MVCLLGATGHAYPLAHSTLWDLAADAELIVVARVGARRPSPALPLTYKAANRDRSVNLFDRELVQLDVLETLSGPRFEAVDVANPAALACVAPARLTGGHKALVFLSQHGSQWYVVSDGALYPTDRELPAYVAQVKAALALQRAHPTPAQLQEWSVATAEHPVTRWYGLSQLSYDDRARAGANELTPAQRDRLKAAFIKSPTTDTTLGLSMLRDVKNPALDAAFVGAFETALADEDSSPFDLLETLRSLLERFTDKRAVDELLGPKEAYDPALAISTIERAWRTARERFSIPKGALVEPVVRCTGSDTTF
jgi:hypothetical protein